MKRWLLTPALALATAMLVYASPQSEADPNADYFIHSQAGTWVVVVHTYTGVDAHDLAHQLVYHLRKDHNVPAYIWNVSEKKRAEMKADEERWHQQYPERPFKHWRIDDEYGVLIAGFDSMENAKAFKDNELMNKNKYPLPPLKLGGGKSAFDMGVLLEEGPNGQMKTVRGAISPYAGSFVSRNPSLPPTQKKADPFLKTLNEYEEYSLLKCSQPWTLALQCYGGGGTYVEPKAQEERSMVGKVLDAFKFGNDDGKFVEKELNAAAGTARDAARVLKQLGFEAYVLHTRTASLVTVGGFSSANDPAIQRVSQRLAELDLYKKMQLQPNGVPYQIPRP